MSSTCRKADRTIVVMQLLQQLEVLYDEICYIEQFNFFCTTNLAQAQPKPCWMKCLASNFITLSLSSFVQIAQLFSLLANKRVQYFLSRQIVNQTPSSSLLFPSLNLPIIYVLEAYQYSYEKSWSFKYGLYKLDMDLQEFIQKVKQSPHKIKKGKEEQLYNTVRQHGYEDPIVHKAIEECCPPKFVEGMKEFIKIIPVVTGFDIRSFAEGIALNFIQEKFLRPKDLTSMISFIRKDKLQAVEDIGEAYGMRQEYKDDFERLIKDVRHAGEETRNAAGIQALWIQFDNILMRDCGRYELQTLKGKLQGKIIDSPEKLEHCLLSHKIFIKKGQPLPLFEAVNNLGMEHPITHQAISDSTYKAFKNDLLEVCKSIPVRMPSIRLEDFLAFLKGEKVKKQDIHSLLENYFKGQERQVDQIIEDYGLDGPQDLKKNLAGLTSHLDQHFRHFQIERILQISKSPSAQNSQLSSGVIEIADQSSSAIEILDFNDFKPILQKLKDNLVNSHKVQQKDTKELIVAYVSGDGESFKRIGQSYGLYGQQDLMNQISVQLDCIFKDLSPQEKSNMKQKIYEHLACYPKNKIQEKQQKQPQKDNKKVNEDKGMTMSVINANQSIINVDQDQEPNAQFQDNDYYCEEIRQIKKTSPKNSESKGKQVTLAEPPKYAKQIEQQKEKEQKPKEGVEQQFFDVMLDTENDSPQPLAVDKSHIKVTAPGGDIRQTFNQNTVNELLKKEDNLGKLAPNLDQSGVKSPKKIKGQIQKERPLEQRPQQIPRQCEDNQRMGKFRPLFPTTNLAQDGIFQNMQIRTNPFHPAEELSISNDNRVKIVFVYISEQPVDKKKLFKVKKQNQQSSIMIKYSSYNFMGLRCTILSFEIKKGTKYNLNLTLTVNYQSITQPIQITTTHSYGCCRFIIMEDPRIIERFKNIIPSVRNYAIFQCVGFIIRELFPQKQYIQSGMFIWLKLLYDAERRIESEQLNSQILKKVQISKDFPIPHSKFFLYLLFSIFKQKGLYYYERLDLAQKMTFPSAFQQFMSKKTYPDVQDLYYLYLQLHLMDTIVKPSEYHYYLSSRLLQNNITYQPQSRIIEVLVTVANKAPRLLVAADKEIVKLFNRQKSQLCVHDYYNVRIKYLRLLLDSQKINQQKIAMDFLADLIHHFQQKSHVNCRKKVYINNNDVQALFSEEVGNFFFKNKNLRVGEGVITQLYSRCKILDSISKHQLNFMEVASNIVRMKMDSLTSTHSLTTFTSALTIPINKLDNQLIQTIIANGAIHTYHMKQLIQALIGKNSKRYDIPQFQNIVFDIARNEHINIEADVVFAFIDNFYSMQKQVEKRQLLVRLFALFTPKMKVVDQVRGSYFITPATFKKYLECYFKLKNEDFRNIYINKIFEQVKAKINNREIDIINQIQKAFPKFVEQNKLKSQRLIHLYLETTSYNVEDMERQILNFLKCNSSYFGFLNKRHGANYETALRNIIKAINDDDIYKKDLDQFIVSISGRKAISAQLNNAIFLCSAKIETFINRIGKIINILNRNPAVFKDDLVTIRGYEKSVNQLRLVDVYKVETKYQSLLQYSYEIYIIQQYIFWDKEKNTSIQNIIIQFSRIKGCLITALTQFESGIITYKNFKKYFLSNNFKDIHDYYMKVEDVKKIAYRYNAKLCKNEIQKILEYSQSLQYMYRIIKGSDLNMSFTKFYQLANNIENEVDFPAKELFEEMKEVQMKLIEVYELSTQWSVIQSLSKYLQKEESARIVNSTFKAKKMFDMISQKNYEVKSIADLKEYINDLQNSVLKMETIKQFENVLVYWQLAKKAPNFKKFITELNQFVKNKKADISNCIDNCLSTYRLIQQKMDEAVNRETSFKYEIQAIFRDSIFRINADLQLQIVIKVQNMDINAMKSTNLDLGKDDRKEIIIDYKRMNLYKDKSILLINDIGRDQNLDEGMREMKKLFERYSQIFTVIEGIHNLSQKLSNYGYNPKEISCQIHLLNGDTKEIQQIRTELMETSKTWLEGIKKLYSRSYLLTHFLGSQLNKFIDNCIKQIYSPSLARIINMSQQQFYKQFQSPFFSHKIAQASRGKPLQRVQCIIQAFEHFEKKFMDSSRCIQIENIDRLSSRNLMFQNHKDQNDKPIILLTCSAKEIYSCLIELDSHGEKKIAKPTQVLYCQESTSPQEIEFFLYRAMICSTKTHFIVGAHNLKQQIKLIFCDQLSILLRERTAQLRSAQLCFIDDVINDRLYAYVSRPKLFHIEKKELFLKEAEEGTKSLMKLIKKTIMVTANKAGLGKTFFVEQQAKIKRKRVRYFPICGNVKFENLAKRLKGMNLEKTDSLLIQIGHVQNKKKLQVFLSQIIIFRCFYFQEYIFVPEDIEIYIEMENVVALNNEDAYYILNILKDHNKIHNIEKFDVKLIHQNLQNDEDKFVYVYLSHLTKPNWITNHEYSYNDYLKQRQKVPFPQNYQELLEMYFVKWFTERNMEPTFIIFKSFKNMLFNAFKSFSESPFLSIANFMDIDPAFRKLQLQKSRQNFLKICISNALQLLKETVTTNDFDQHKNALQAVSDMIKKFPMLIISSFNCSNYQFVYLNDESVNIPIKSLLLSQNPRYFQRLQNMTNIDQLHQIFNQSSLSNSQGAQQQLRMFKILRELSGNKKFQGTIQNVYKEVPELFNYKLTLDNFFKMCLIIHRSSSFIPSVIMGESGVGKTALIDFLVRVVYQEKLEVFNVHAGIHEEDLEVWVMKVRELAKLQQIETERIRQQLLKETETIMQPWLKERRVEQARSLKARRIWVFFDQFNTTDQLNYIKQMVIDRRFLGEALPDNVIFLAACNPYRKRQESVDRVKAGIKKTTQNKGAELAFKVKPPSLSMIQLMWDYQQLGEKQNSSYIQKMLAEIKYTKIKPLIKAIVDTHQHFKRAVEVSSVSLRDVARFKQLYNWFLIHSPTEDKPKTHPLLNKQDRISEPAQRAAILAFTFCYALRYSTNKQRKTFLQSIQTKLDFQKNYMQNVLQTEQIGYINQLKIKGEKIAYNSALMENVFTSLVCLMNKIPVLIIGNPGSSKSLSIKMLNSNLRGENSSVPFCQKLPEINMIYYQGSQASTSKGVQQVFQKAISNKINTQNSKLNILNCILFDQIGLAQKSIHNPLKVLHAKLQTNIKDIGFIGISNWELDAAKMSRFLVISRSNPDQAEVKDTAVKIYQSYIENDTAHIERFKMLGSHYFRFINKWNVNLNNRDGFFGLRDFYSYVKYVCSQIILNGNDPAEIDKAITRAIQINFDGQRESLKIFRQIASTSQNNILSHMNPIQLVNKNLEDTDSRCLMLIIRGDSLIPIINDKIMIKGVSRKAFCVYGSTFLEDQESQEYNLEITSLIINHVSRGNILAFKDINNSIQTSLYDLFNKSFSHIGNKRYCRIAVGANSNPKCNVHQNFNAIVYVDQEKLKYLDLAFLNRFQKHYLNLKSMITKEEIEMLETILKWINQEVLSFKDDDMILKNENFLINSSEESIVTLIIKYRGEPNIINRIKADLLKNKTTDLTIALKDNPQVQAMVKGTESLNISPQNCLEDMIVYTYDQFSNLAEEKTIFNGRNYIIRLSQMKNEKGLRKELKTALSSEDYDRVEIKVYYQHHYMHLNFLLFLAKEIKASLESKKQIIIIIQLHRFTLHQLNIQYINISYLHKFQQYFIEDIHSLEDVPLLLDSSNCWETYERLNLSEKIGNYFIDALKLIKFKCENQEIEQLKELYFMECIEISNNDYYQESIQNILHQYLKGKKIKYSAIQRNHEDIMCCSNIYEAIAKYVGEMVKEVIFYSIRLVVEEGFLFYFDDKRTHRLLEKEISEYLKDPYMKQYQSLVGFFHKHFEQQRTKLIKKLQKPQFPQQNKYQKAIESNIVRIKSQINLIPTSFKDFSLLFKDKQDKGGKSLQQASIKIPFFRKEQNEDEYGIHYQGARNFIQTQFKITSFNILEEISRSKNLQKIYLYDILTFALISNNQSDKNIHLYIEIMLFTFQQYNLVEKLIMLTNDKRLIFIIFQFFSLLFKQMDPKDVLRQTGQIKKKDQGNPLIQVIQSLFKIGMNLVKFNPKKVGEFQSVGHYITYFRSIFIKIRELYTGYGEYGLQFTKEFLTTNKLLEMFQKIEIPKEELVAEYAKILDEKHTIYFSIFNLCDTLLMSNRLKTTKQIIINFLSLDIFCNWLQKILDEEAYADEKQDCIRSFVGMCNKYTLFANNSAYFISMILPNLDEVQAMQLVMEYFSAKENNTFFKEEYIELESNFTVALSNHISAKIQEIFAKELTVSVQTQEEVFITKNYQRYFLQLANMQEESMIFKLFKIEFMKRYAFYYLQILNNNKENDLQNRIDTLLCQENELMRHIRLYLLKHLYVNYESFEDIKRDFIIKKRCKWINMLKQLFQQPEIESFIPPKLLQQGCKLYKLMQQLSDNKFSHPPTFNELILQGLKSPINRYELLTYFMLNFYTKMIAQNFLDQMKYLLNSRHDIKYQQNGMIWQLLKRYLDHKVMNNYEFTTNDEFMRQIPLLNYLNIITSLNMVKNPLNDMFFTDRGLVNFDYSGYLNNRFLIGSMKNPALGRLEFILKRQEQKFAASSYINCSKNCDYLSPVGGNFYGTYDGCANPYHQSKCAFCGSVIGAHAYNVLSNPEAKKFMPDTVNQMLPVIQARKTVTLRHIDQNFEYELMGYTLGNTKEKLINALQLKKHYAGVATDFLQGESEMVHHKLLQTIINCVWSFFVQINFIKQQSLKALFHYDKQNSKIFLHEAVNFYFQQTNKSIKLTNKNDYIIWHLGIGKLLMNELLDYNNKIKTKLIPNDLRNPIVRDTFEKYIKDFLFPYCQQEKQRLILESRTVRTINKTDIVRQIGNLKDHLLQYPCLKLYKLLKLDMSPSYKNMKKYYKETLAKNYPILFYLMNNQTVQEKLKLFKSIFTFISKLRKIFNLQITREESKKPLCQAIASIFKENQGQKIIVQVEMGQFIRSWNRLAQLKYQLRHQCHDFGQLTKVDKTYPLHRFLLDKKHMDNIQGRRLIGLITVSAQQYNSICGIIQNNVKAAYSQQSAQIFSSNPLNPTLLSRDSKVLLFPTKILNDKIEQYSSYSVQYGISNPSYPFDQIQSMVAKEFYGCKYLITEEEKYCYINYIGQQVHFITELREDKNQKQMDNNIKQKVNQYVKKIQKEETLYKTIKGIQGSLENIVIFFKNFKANPQMHTMTIRNFVNEKKIKVVKQILQEPIQSLQLSYLAHFYETIQFLTFERVKDMLENVYKKQLDRAEKEQFIGLIKSMKRETRQARIPSYLDFKTALYRLAGRNLLLMMSDENKTISQHLCYVDFYWPKDVDIDFCFQQEQQTEFTTVMKKLPVSKVGDMLNLLPFKEKMAEQEDITRSIGNNANRGQARIERVLENRPKMKTFKNRKAFD